MPDSAMHAKPFAQVTMAEAKAIYDRNPVINELWEWEEVKETPNILQMLKHQASITAEVEETTNPSATAAPKCRKQSAALLNKKRYVLGKQQVAQIRNALRMARNGMNMGGELLKHEALAEIYHAEQIFHTQEQKHIEQQRSKARES